MVWAPWQLIESVLVSGNWNPTHAHNLCLDFLCLDEEKDQRCQEVLRRQAWIHKAGLAWFFLWVQDST